MLNYTAHAFRLFIIEGKFMDAQDHILLPVYSSAMQTFS